MNSLAWNLMTDKETAGQYDRLAMAVAKRMQKRGSLKHQYTDTVALANFLNGQVDEAIALQKRAVTKNDSDDYRRRLRTYEAAKRGATPSAAQVKASKRSLINVDEE